MGLFDSLGKGIAGGLSALSTMGVIKDFGVTWDSDMGWTTTGATGGVARYPGSDRNWALDAGDPMLNSVVSICAQYIFDKVIEPRVHIVYEDNQGLLQPVAQHPCTELLLRPNGQYMGNALLQALALSYKLSGNAYAYKVRGRQGSGAPVELWYIPHWLIWPLPPDDGGPTQFYNYREPRKNGGYIDRPLPASNIIHIQNGLDLSNPRMGMSQLRAQFRGIVTDNEIDTTVALVLRNRGIFGAIVTPKYQDQEITPEQSKDLKRKMETASTGDMRGSFVGLGIPVNIERTAMTPADLQLSQIGERPQARICATFGIDPLAVGLANSGQGKGGQYGARLAEARSLSYEQCILPTLAALAEAFTYQLLIPDFGGVDEKPKSLRRHVRRRWVRAAAPPNSPYRVNFDYSDVRELSEDDDALHGRAVADFGGNLLTLDEGREMIGLPPAEDAEMGGKFAFQLLGASKGGEFGTPPAQDDEQREPTPTDPPADPDDEDLPEEGDEDFNDDDE